MIFVDSNIPMYLIGEEHPNKERTVSLLQRLVNDETRLVTDAETLKEIMHRYYAIGRFEAIQPAFDALFGFIDEVFPVCTEDVIRAKDFLLSYTNISPRDAVHASVMKNRGIEQIFSFDTGFDVFAFITRLA